MDKNVLKKFAIESRQELMEKVANKINRYFVDEEFNVNQNGEVYILANNKHTLRLTKNEYENRQLLVKRIKEISLEQVIEEAAYTWFNRIIAIRYMEIHDYLPLTKENQSLGVRVLSSKDNTPDPEILKISNLINSDLDIGFNKEYYGTIQDNNKRFEYILLLICKKLGKVIPQVFDGVTDYIDILIPDNLLNDSGYVSKLLKDLSEDNFMQVEIIGWLYQYYNQTEKDRVISAKKAYKKYEIPFVTQLFTPDWIVKYMVQNSLGKYWLDIDSNSAIKHKMEYYIENSSINSHSERNIEDVKIIDPCSGSGHILIYIFQILFEIYLENGYTSEKIPQLILENNLYGLDIDDRAGQLSVLSIILEARKYDKNIYKKINNINIMSIQESNLINVEHLNLIKKYSNSETFEIVKYVCDIFENAKELGTMIKVEKKEYQNTIDDIKKIREQELNIFELEKIKEIEEKILPLLKQAIILSDKYECVITNPPYMGERYMSEIVKKYVRQEYHIARTDMFSTFILVCNYLCKENGYIGLVTPYAWMFLDSYKDLRKYMIDNLPIVSLIQLEFNAFEVAALPVCTFILTKNNVNYNGKYIKLSDFPGPENQPIKVLEALTKKVDYMYQCEMQNYNAIDGNPISFWLSDNMRNIFKNSKKISDFGITKQGMVTGDNKKFLRLWYEPDINKINFNAKSLQDAQESRKKWFPYNKGGRYRKWYGNNEYVVNYENDGEEVKEYTSHLPQGTAVRIKSRDYYFKEAITWTFISIDIGVRYSKIGAIFDVAGSSLFVDNKNIKYVLGFMCSKLMKIFNQILNPTMNVQTSNVAQLPLIINQEYKNRIDEIVDENINLAKEEWDDFETSWDFSQHPLIKYKLSENCKISDTFKEWERIAENRFNRVKKNEIELNDLFIKIYGLENEIVNIIEDKEITIRKANREREIKSLISYFIGCLFGRYSLDETGLICTNKELPKDKYKSFLPDTDNIIPLIEDVYFEDDIIKKFKEFLTCVYGKQMLNENINYIAETLGMKDGENSEEVIRKYFINNFFNDHCDTYSVIGSGKRPIYWEFESGKKNAFKCLIYAHRYNEGLVSKIRLDYIHKVQNAYEKELKEINERINSDIDLTTKRELSKKQSDITLKLQEINEYEEKIAHIADQKITLDLDDGIVVNYEKFKVINPKTGKDESILAKIK